MKKVEEGEGGGNGYGWKVQKIEGNRKHRDSKCTVRLTGYELKRVWDTVDKEDGVGDRDSGKGGGERTREEREGKREIVIESERERERGWEI